MCVRITPSVPTMETKDMDKKEFALIATWVLVLVVALTIPKCSEDSAIKANREYQEKLKQNAEQYQVPVK